MTVRTLQHLYSLLAPAYDAFAVPVASAGRRAAVKVLHLDDGMRVLDAGTGTGLTLPLLRAAADVEVDAVDVTAAMLDRAAVRVPDGGSGSVRLHREDLRALPFADDVFDAATCTYTLDVMAPSDASTALREVRRVLRPDARLAVTTLGAPTSPAARVWTHLARVAPVLLGGSRPTAPRAMLHHAGFVDIDTRSYEQWGLPSALAWGRAPTH